MSRVMEYQLKGKSDVEQVTGRARKSMEQMNTTVASMNKKFSEIGKDLFLRFLAPVLLIDKAINMLTGAISRLTEGAEAGIESIGAEGTMPVSREIQMTADRVREILKAREDSEKFAKEMQRMTKSAFLETEIGQKYLDELRAKERFHSLISPIFTESMAARPEVQMELAKRIAAASPDTTKQPEAKKDFKIEQAGGSVIGVGQSAVVMAVQETNELLRKVVENTRPITGVLDPTGGLYKSTYPSGGMEPDYVTKLRKNR
jgi:hypothetical protein